MALDSFVHESKYLRCYSNESCTEMNYCGIVFLRNRNVNVFWLLAVKYLASCCDCICNWIIYIFKLNNWSSSTKFLDLQLGNVNACKTNDMYDKDAFLCVCPQVHIYLCIHYIRWTHLKMSTYMVNKCFQCVIFHSNYYDCSS